VYQSVRFYRQVGFSLAAPQPGFTPADYGDDLILWLDAEVGVYKDAGTTLAADGETVQQWNDQSGNGYHMSQGTAGDRPTFRATSALTNQPAVQFNQDWLSSGTDAVSLGGGVVAVFGVLRWVSPAGSGVNSRHMAFIGNGQSSDFNNEPSFMMCIGSGELRTFRNAGPLNARSVSLDTNYRIGGIWDGTNYTNYINNSAGTPTANTGTFGSTGTLHFVNPGDGGAAAMVGYVCEMVIIKRALDSGERAELDAYFTSRWGL
jgi:hypothetical protein